MKLGIVVTLSHALGILGILNGFSTVCAIGLALPVKLLLLFTYRFYDFFLWPYIWI